ncbi:MAG: peptidoglycan -binding protein [Acetobacteraceae bacterium]|jgi:chemotaxis protein MotB
MAVRARRAGGNGLEAWPGYVDALSTLLMVVMFVLLVFVLAQAMQAVVLAKRNDQLGAANQTLVQERERNAALSQNLSEGDAARAALLSQLRDLNQQTANTMAERDKLAALLKQVELAAAAAATMNKTLTAQVTEQTQKADTATAANQQLTTDLAAAQVRLRDMQTQIAALDQTVKADKDTIDAKISDLARLAEQTRALTALRDDLQEQVKTAAAATLTEQQKRQATEALLANEKQLGDTAQAKIAMLTQQVEQLQSELSVSEKQRSDEQAKASNLTQQLNLALAAQVEELRKYRSDFFGKLRQVLAGRPGIQIVGDRFVFQSEVLFGISSAELTPAGIAQMTQLAATFHQIIDKIPPDVNWVLRVDGHTDATPIHNARFASNWELSAARAIAVVKFLITQGIPATHLAATGFGEFQPVDPGNTPAAYAKNRRIEIRLTDR